MRWREHVPCVSTIWRILKRRGLITPEPHKRPRSSWVRFEAALPNERWQSDVTHWRLSCGTQVDILNFIDDHSRLIVASEAIPLVRATDVLRVFSDTAARWGIPASLLTDIQPEFDATPCAIGHSRTVLTSPAPVRRTGNPIGATRRLLAC